MPIAIRFNGHASIEGLGGDFVVLCDHCGEEIPQDGAHNIENESGAPGELRLVKFFHYHCSMLAQQARGTRHLWSKLQKITIETT